MKNIRFLLHYNQQKHEILPFSNILRLENVSFVATIIIQIQNTVVVYFIAT